MADAVPHVVGLDSSLDRVEFCLTEYAGVAGLEFECADVLRADLGEFDVVTCSATLHHLPLEAGLRRLSELVAPGGTLVVVGLALEGTWSDHLISALSVLPNRVAMASRGLHRHGAPTADPRETYSDIRSLAQHLLPGARFRRHAYWRYSLVWERPLDD
jgi:SAM-dependent methyltransferase